MRTLLILIVAAELWHIILYAVRYVSNKWAGSDLGWIVVKRYEGCVKLKFGGVTEKYETTITVSELKRFVAAMNSKSPIIINNLWRCTELGNDYVKIGCQTVRKTEINKIVHFLNTYTMYKINYLN